MTFVCAVTIVTLTYNVTLLVAVPILLSVRYFNEKYTIHVSIISIIVFFFAYVFGANYGMLDLNFVQYEPGTTIVTNKAMWLDDAVREIPYDGMRMIKNTIISNYFVKLLQLIIISAASWQMVVHCQELLQKEKDLAENTARIGAELEMAERIQKDVLPSIFPLFSEKKEFDLYASMTTAREVGGDFYDFFMIDDSHLCLVIADVSGKGVPAAMFMMTAKTMIKDYALTKSGPSEIFTAVNDRLCENNEAGMFATAWIGILDLKTMKMQFTNAGHNFPMILRKDMPCRLLEKKHGLFLAGMDGVVYNQDEIQLASGDRLLLYTDGVTEAHNSEKELFGEERMMKILESSIENKGEEVLSRIVHEVEAFADNTEQFDDITMSILTIK
jgi:serine phosphatase RsbU (regulator of sigma subunit)